VDHPQLAAAGDVLPVRLATPAFRDAVRANIGKRTQFHHRLWLKVRYVFLFNIVRALTPDEKNLRF
jgi:hypothetical protein